MTQNSEDKVRDLAYHLWVEAGQPEGRAMDFWLAAELHVSGMVAAAQVAAPVKPRAAKPKAAPKAAPSEDKPKAAPRSRAKAK